MAVVHIACELPMKVTEEEEEEDTRIFAPFSNISLFSQSAVQHPTVEYNWSPSISTCVTRRTSLIVQFSRSVAFISLDKFVVGQVHSPIECWVNFFFTFQYYPALCLEQAGVMLPVRLLDHNYGCQVCAKVGRYSAMVAHVQTHERAAVKHNGNERMTLFLIFSKSTS